MIDFSGFARGAEIERNLRQLQPGECVRMTPAFFDGVRVPTDPLDRQTPEFLVHWFHVRMPFPCDLHYDPLRDYWELCRPAS
jgi:hypothetical protein